MRHATALLLLGLAGRASEVETTADPAAALRALAPVQDSASIALAGDAELFTRVRGRVLEVRRVAPPS